MVSYQIEPWGRNECGQLLEQFVGREHEVGSPVGPGNLEGEGKAFVVGYAQSSCRQGRAGDLAAQLLEPLPVIGGDAGGRMQGKAAGGEAQGRGAHTSAGSLKHPS